MKVSKLVLYILLAVCVAVMGAFYFGGGTDQALTDAVDAEVFYVPNYTSLIINWSMVLLGVAVLAAILLALYGFALAPKQSMKSLVGVALIVVVLIIAYSLSDVTPVKLAGQEKLFTDEFRLRLADVCLYSSWILLVLTFVAIVFAYVKKLTK